MNTISKNQCAITVKSINLIINTSTLIKLKNHYISYGKILQISAKVIKVALLNRITWTSGSTRLPQVAVMKLLRLGLSSLRFIAKQKTRAKKEKKKIS